MTLPDNKLTWQEEDFFALLIDKSIIAPYRGDLERLGADQDGGVTYCPLDRHAILELLDMLWGNRLTTIDQHSSGSSKTGPANGRTVGARKTRTNAA